MAAQRAIQAGAKDAAEDIRAALNHRVGAGFPVSYEVQLVVLQRISGMCASIHLPFNAGSFGVHPLLAVPPCKVRARYTKRFRNPVGGRRPEGD